MKQTNKPLIGAQVEQLKMQKRTIERKTKYGVVKIEIAASAYVHEYPNRRSCRAEKCAVKSKNRKNTAGRYAQFVDITVKERRGFGTVNVPTGYVKKIVHHPVAKIINAAAGK